jgi:Hydantoinase B/oxoprolinase
MNEALKRIHMQVMWNRLIAVVEEQAQALLHTAFGAITREAGDLSAGVYDTGGRMLAQAVTGTPGHVNTMAAAVRHFLDRYPITGRSLRFHVPHARCRRRRLLGRGALGLRGRDLRTAPSPARAGGDRREGVRHHHGELAQSDRGAW